MARSPDDPQRIRVASVFELSVLCLPLERAPNAGSRLFNLISKLQISNENKQRTNKQRTVQKLRPLYSSVDRRGSGPITEETLL